MVIIFVVGAFAACVIDFGAIRLINRLESMRPEPADQERRSFTFGDKYFLPFAAGFEAIIVCRHYPVLTVHPWLIGLAALGLVFGLEMQRRQLRRDPVFAHKFAQWYHALVASPLMVFVVTFPIIATLLRLGPWWALAAVWLGVLAWACCTYDDIRSGRMYPVASRLSETTDITAASDEKS